MKSHAALAIENFGLGKAIQKVDSTDIGPLCSDNQ